MSLHLSIFGSKTDERRKTGLVVVSTMDRIRDEKIQCRTTGFQPMVIGFGNVKHDPAYPHLCPEDGY